MRIFFKSISYLFFLILVVVLTYTLFAFYGYFGSLEPGGKSINSELPKKVLNSKIRSQLRHSNSSKQILFGDTHVHTTYSSDAFLWSLPMYNGRGPHPVSDACDYARFCSALDFWVISDHAEASTPHKWNNTIEQVQSCNKSTDPENPDMITFLGFEWTQIGDNREEHYGHKNVILKEIDSEYLPQSPIAAGGDSLNNFRDPNRVNETRINMMVQAYSDLGNRQRYYDFIAYNTDITSSPVCTGSADDNKDCLASADTPKELFTKLNALKTDSIVIPHGNTWGFYSPLGTSWDDKLDDVHDPDRQISFEIMSGHGNSEEYRSWTEVIFDGDNLICPEESDNYLPSCKQAGNIIYERCIENGKRENECRQDASQAEIFYLQAGQSGHFVVPGATPESWLDSGQCKDCFIPSFNYRPKGSFQYALTKKGRNNEKFIFGVIASSDNHRARPGTGYKAVDRLLTTESNGIKDPAFERLAYPLDEISDTPVEFKIEERFIPNPLAYWESERQETFFTTGGLAAVHVDSRSREGVWEAFKRRETYGTSGPRILLWFDLITENGLVPMGSEITVDENPTFQVKAVGSFKQKPGCPDYSLGKRSAEDIKNLCMNECFNPSSERYSISRIEIIKVLPEINTSENPEELIMDPWKTFECEENKASCKIRFQDEDFASDNRDATFYVRAIQEPSERINGKNLRCTYDDEGNCIETNFCYGGYKTDIEDNCISMSEERAWSSPIYLSPLKKPNLAISKLD
jgi:hypothetical protein|nr:MAG: hypothetical protein CM15mP61_09820 [Gammaproteobacteria bacterium]